MVTPAVTAKISGLRRPVGYRSGYRLARIFHEPRPGAIQNVRDEGATSAGDAGIVEDGLRRESGILCSIRQRIREISGLEDV